MICLLCSKELCSTLEAKEDIYKQLLQRGQQILAMTPEGQDSSTELDLRNLQEKWECVQAKVAERKVRENIIVFLLSALLIVISTGMLGQIPEVKC